MRKALFILLLLAIPIFAIEVLTPVQANVGSNEELYLGRVGPGQTVFFSVQPKIWEGGVHGIGGRWDQIVFSNVPPGWTGSPSKLYADPLQAELQVAPDARDGRYIAKATIVDEEGGEKLGNIPINLAIEVDRKVLEMEIAPSSIQTGAGQPARYSITLRNTGVANDVFTLASSGLPDWNFQRNLYVPAGSSKKVAYEIVGNEEGMYPIKIISKSTSSPLIVRSQDVRLDVKTDLISDFKATRNGVLLFPFLEGPLYFAVSIISNFL
jgi:hypothetical protein